MSNNNSWKLTQIQNGRLTNLGFVSLIKLLSVRAFPSSGKELNQAKREW